MWGLTLGYRTAIETAAFLTLKPEQMSAARVQLVVVTA